MLDFCYNMPVTRGVSGKPHIPVNHFRPWGSSHFHLPSQPIVLELLHSVNFAFSGKDHLIKSTHFRRSYRAAELRCFLWSSREPFTFVGTLCCWTPSDKSWSHSWSLFQLPDRAYQMPLWKILVTRLCFDDDYKVQHFIKKFKWPKTFTWGCIIRTLTF